MAFEAARKEDFSCESWLLSFHALQKVLHAFKRFATGKYCLYLEMSCRTLKCDTQVQALAQSIQVRGSVFNSSTLGMSQNWDPPKDHQLVGSGATHPSG